MDKYQYWFNAFVKKPYAVIAVLFIVVSVELAYKLIDVDKTHQIELIESKKIIERQTEIILELSTQKAKFETMVELNDQLRKQKKGK